MPGRTVSIELTDEQTALLDEIAVGRETTPDKLLLEAIAHGLAMIAAGVDEVRPRGTLGQARSQRQAVAARQRLSRDRGYSHPVLIPAARLPQNQQCIGEFYTRYCSNKMLAAGGFCCYNYP